MSLKEKKLLRPLPIGISEFTEIIETSCYYSDKTLFIKRFLDTAAKVILFARPRRFGKTLNMTMMRTFFEKRLDGKDTSHYFKNLKIWQAGEKYTKEQGRRPVIYLTLKDIKFNNFSDAIKQINYEVYEDLKRHPEIFESKNFNSLQQKQAEALLNSNDISVLSGSIKTISELLYAHHGIQPMIIIDEYDTPIQTANEYGYYEDMVNFMRIFLSSAFKDNPSLYRGMLTGITRVSKESIFSGLNNLKVDTIFNTDFSDCFGLTAEEVSDMLDFYDVPDKKEEAAHWYDGYMFGDTEIYNPWSMIEYLDNNCIAQPYWVNTSSNALVGQALEMADQDDSKVLEDLVNGGTVETEINTNVIYPEIMSNINVAYSLLAQTGYLKSIHNEIDDGRMICTLKIPNRELRTIYFDEILNRFVKDSTAGRKAGELRRAMTKGNAEKIERLVQDYLMSALSFHDLTEEKDYHNVFLGLVYIATDNYSIKSNRESGEGRYDIAMFPKRNNLPGIIFELKHYRAEEGEKADRQKLEKSLEKAAEEALKQIENNAYLTELKEAGAGPIFRYGAAFCGKKAKVISRNK
jgi:hypothetical protein